MAARWFYYLFLASIFVKTAEMYAAHACGSGLYGLQCNKRCSDRHCADVSTPCPAWDGLCSGKCQDGWRGRDCTTACSEDGRYGAKCRFLCSSRHCASSRVSCDTVTGDCGPEGCEPGWKGIDCKQTCERRVKYGPNCKKSCSHRHCATTSNYCPFTSGKCHDGCQPGWKGVDCLQECNNTYGTNCGLTCSVRHCKNDNSSCDSKTGECVGGCKPGWKNLSCTEECSFWEYGENCKYECTERRCYGRQRCDPERGECVDGCIDGWNGISCTEAKPLKTINITLVSFCVSLGVLIILLVISGLIIARFVLRKHLLSSKRELTESKELKKENAETNQVPTYDSAYEEVSDKNSNAEHQYQNVRQSEKCSEPETNTYEKLENDMVDEPSPYDVINIS